MAGWLLLHSQSNGTTENAIGHGNRHVMEVMEVRCKAQENAQALF
jgi:hypothetical protein